LDGTLDSLERIRSIPLAFSDEGSVTRVGDIAEVTRAFANPPRSLAMVNGKPGVMIAARMQEDMRVAIWTADMKARVADFSALLPAGVSAEIIFDQSVYTDERLSGLMGNLIIGAIIVLLVLLVTLGWKASIIAGSILPLATLSALAILYASGFRVQQIVVTGLIVGLGIMVDNAIVVTDSIQTELLKGVRRAVAVSKTIRRLWLPLLGSTTTTVIAFMPILLMPGHAGEFVGGIAAAVIASIIASYIIAFTITSAIAGRVLKLGDDSQMEPQDKPTRKWWREGLEGRAISTWFKATLESALQRPARTMLFAMVLPLAGFVLSQTLSEQFFPPGDRDQFHLRLTLPASASITNTQSMVEEVHELFMADERVKSVQWTIGTGSPKFYYNLFGGRENSPNMAEAMVNATHMKHVDGVIAKFQPLLDERFPSAQVLVRNLEQGPPYSAPIEIRILGPDLETLRALGEAIRSELASIPHVLHTNATLNVGQPKVVVKVDEDEAGIVGLTLRDVADQIRGAVDGEIGGSIIEAVEEVPVRVRVQQQKRDSFNSLGDLQLEPGRGGLSEAGSYLGVPLSAIAELQLEPSIGAISRRNGVRVNAIQGFLENNILPDTVFKQLEEKLAQSDLLVPSGYRIEFGGESAERDNAVGGLMSTVGVLFVLMVFAVVLTYNSFRLASITFAAAFQAAGLGFLALWVFGYPRGFIVIVGIMGLVGLAINAAIVILSELKSNKQARAGDTDAIVAGVMSTGRHIVSTTFTTVGGFMPLILSSAEFWPPFAVVIAGGTLMSMIVSFFFAP
ncbi:MAG: efflux RND transporter permease subunit, partial [Sphingomonadales bacterium]|nr:efflux RND transporter permease subunit [Sphingomonadales bacterium]